MKVELLITTLLLFLSSCANKIDNTEEKIDLFNEALIRSENSNIIEKNLYLDFKFGMTKKMVEAHAKKLLKSNILKKDYSGRYYHVFLGKYGMEFNVFFSPEYYNGELYKMTYAIESSIISNGKEYVMMCSSFKESERSLDFDLYIKDGLLEDGDKEYFFIKDNLIISFKNSVRSVMIYENSPVSKIAKNELDKNEKTVYENNLTNF